MTLNARGFLVSFYRASAVFLLLVTGTAKLVSAVGQQGVLDTIDPIFGIRLRWLLMLLGVVELVVAFTLVKHGKPWFACLLSSMLGAQFILYHKIFQIEVYNRGCPCLGTMAQWLPVPQPDINIMLMLTAAWLCLGGAIACHLAYPYARKAGFASLASGGSA